MASKTVRPTVNLNRALTLANEWRTAAEREGCNHARCIQIEDTIGVLVGEWSAGKYVLPPSVLVAMGRGAIVNTDNLRQWARSVDPGEYLATYGEDRDDGSRCGYSDSVLAQVRRWLGERGLTLRADDCGLEVVEVQS